MSDEGFEAQRKAGEEPAQASNQGGPLEGPGSDERLKALQDRFTRAGPKEGLSTFQLVCMGLFIFMLILIFGGGRYIIADMAPKLPPGVDINAPNSASGAPVR